MKLGHCGKRIQNLTQRQDLQRQEEKVFKGLLKISRVFISISCFNLYVMPKMLLEHLNMNLPGL